MNLPNDRITAAGDGGPSPKDGSPPLKITVITPNFNGAVFLEETIRSVLDQDYPNLEYIICDGGSTDDSVSIIRRYEHRLTRWVSEPDGGQPAAINKGLRMSTGDVVAFINSDDLYRPGTLAAVAEAFRDDTVSWISGRCDRIDKEGVVTSVSSPAGGGSVLDWVTYSRAEQPATFWRRALLDRAGLFREDLHYSFDKEYWVRLISLGYRMEVVPKTLAAFRVHPDSKTGSLPLRFLDDDLVIFRDYADRIQSDERPKFAARLRWMKRRRAQLENLKSPMRARLAVAACVLAEPRMLFDYTTWPMLIERVRWL